MASPTGVEIERKFLPTRLPDGLPEGERIEQGYLAIAPDGVEVRVRRRAGVRGAGQLVQVQQRPRAEPLLQPRVERRTAPRGRVRRERQRAA